MQHICRLNSRGGFVTRTVGALMRADIRTMEALATVTPDDIAQIRNIGGKGLALILPLRDGYIITKGKSNQTES